jgi:pimeloyl-ACP methyl ester carboxylesterase
VADLTQADRMDGLARSVLAAAPSQFALAGLSMGGYVALEIMRQAPERVLKLCLLSTSARADTAEQKQRRQLLLALSRNGEFKGVTPRLLPSLVSAQKLDDKELTGTIMAMAERVGREAFHNQQTAILNRVDSRPFLKDIQCPVRVIAGADDVLTPPDLMHEIASALPHVHFNVIKHSGHLSPLERPEEVSALMQQWLVT